MSFQRNGTVSSTFESSNRDKKKKWNHGGPEGIYLRRDIIDGMNDGSLTMEGPKSMSLYNKRPEIYGKFGKNSFRNSFETYQRDYISAMAIKNSAGRTNFSSKASNDSMFEDEYDFRGRDGIAADGFGACNHASAANSSFLPHLLWEWQDSRTNKHVTIRFILPSGCSETDITATIQPGGRSVVITYAWPDIMFQPSQLLAVYSSSSGELMYDEDSAKSVKLSCRIREMMETAGANSGTLKSTYEVALPFPCQEQFTTIKTIVAEHPGIEFVKHYHEEKKTWVHMLNLEMTGLLSSYQPGANAIPTRVFKKAAFKEPPTFRPVAGNPPPDLSSLTNNLCAVLAGRLKRDQDANFDPLFGSDQSRKRACPTAGNVNSDELEIHGAESPEYND